jgi:hypothetical protein
MKVSWSPATSHKVILDANANHNFENAIDLVVKTGLASSSASELFRSLCAEYPPFCQSKRKEIRVAIALAERSLLCCRIRSTFPMIRLSPNIQSFISAMFL